MPITRRDIDRVNSTLTAGCVAPRTWQHLCNHVEVLNKINDTLDEPLKDADLKQFLTLKPSCVEAFLITAPQKFSSAIGGKKENLNALLSCFNYRNTENLNPNLMAQYGDRLADILSKTGVNNHNALTYLSLLSDEDMALVFANAEKFATIFASAGEFGFTYTGSSHEGQCSINPSVFLVGYDAGHKAGFALGKGVGPSAARTAA